MTTTLDTVATMIRERCDQVNSDFVSTPELYTYINDSTLDLYDRVIDTDIWVWSSFVFTLGSGQSTQVFPSDFYRMRGLQRQFQGFNLTVNKVPYSHRNDRWGPGQVAFGYPIPNGYILQAGSIRLVPDQYAPGTYQLDYYPLLTALTGSADPIPSFMDSTGWWEYMVCDGCIKVYEKAEFDASSFERRKDEVLRRVLKAAENRDVDQPQCLDVQRGRQRVRWRLPGR